MNKEIITKIDEINTIIQDSEEYQKYLLLKKKMKKSSLFPLINEIKVLQKDVVHHLDKKELLDSKIKELNDNPLYREYTNTIFEINNWYIIIENRINKYFQDKLN